MVYQTRPVRRDRRLSPPDVPAPCRFHRLQQLRRHRHGRGRDRRGVVHPRAVRQRGAPRIRARIDGPPLRHSNARYHPLPDRRCGPARAHAREAVAGVGRRIGRPGRQRGDRVRAVLWVACHRESWLAQPPGHGERPAASAPDVHQPVAGALQPDPGLPDGWWPRAARRAGHVPELRDGDADRRRAGQGCGPGLWLCRAVLQPDACADRRVCLVRGRPGGAGGADAQRVVRHPGRPGDGDRLPHHLTV